VNPPAGHRPTWAEIDLDALARNFQGLCAHVGPGVKVLAVVKADAYGHGAIPVSKRLESEGADALGVAIVEEGVELRQAGLRSPILVFGGAFPGQEEMAVKHDLAIVVSTMLMVRRLDEAAARLRREATYHLKLDTGMGRLGVPPEDAVRFLTEAKQFADARLGGVMSHLSSAEEHDQAFTDLQTARFERALGQVAAAGIEVPVRHIANSAAASDRTDSRYDMVRAGLLLYGIVSSPKGAPFPVAPVMTLKTRISFLKTVPGETPISYGRTYVTPGERTIATLPIGYADGIQRRLSNKGRVVVRGHSAPIVGSVTMDSTLVDVTAVPGVAPGDEVVVFGGHGGNGQGREGQRVSAEEVAQTIGGIPYEVVCAIGKRVPRVHS